MQSLMLGAVLLALSIFALWYLAPRKDKSGLLDRIPVLASTAPMAITAGIAFGVTFLVSGSF